MKVMLNLISNTWKKQHPQQTWRGTLNNRAYLSLSNVLVSCDPCNHFRITMQTESQYKLFSTHFEWHHIKVMREMCGA